MIFPNFVVDMFENTGPASETWVRREILAPPALRALIDDLVEEMRRVGYGSKDVFSVRLATEEAVVNAIKHGHRDRPGWPVRVAYQLTPHEVLVEVEDDGPGFNPHRVPDPLEADNLEIASGRGLFLMRCYTTWLRYNDRGNKVTMCRRRTSHEPPA
jgi:serine/threonine-protein kinase RsbW